MARRPKEIVVRFAGEGGQGVVTASEMLARAAATVGYHVLTFATFPSQILGGPTWTQTRVSTDPILSPGDDVDVLVALNHRAYEDHRSEVRDGGVILHDPAVKADGERLRTISVPFDALAKQTGEARAANMVLMGALAHLVHMPQEYLADFVNVRFKGRDAVVKANLEALDLGRQHVAEETPIGDVGTPKKPDYDQILIKGNDALSSARWRPAWNSTSATPSPPPLLS